MPVRDAFYTTPAWRAIRLLVLNRDGWECQRQGPRCIGRATHAGHILPRGKQAIKERERKSTR